MGSIKELVRKMKTSENKAENWRERRKSGDVKDESENWGERRKDERMGERVNSLEGE